MSKPYDGPKISYTGYGPSNRRTTYASGIIYDRTAPLHTGTTNPNRTKSPSTRATRLFGYNLEERTRNWIRHENNRNGSASIRAFSTYTHSIQLFYLEFLYMYVRRRILNNYVSWLQPACNVKENYSTPQATLTSLTAHSIYLIQRYVHGTECYFTYEWTMQHDGDNSRTLWISLISTLKR